MITKPNFYSNIPDVDCKPSQDNPDLMELTCARCGLLAASHDCEALELVAKNHTCLTSRANPSQHR